MTKVQKEIDVSAPVNTVYRVWHNFENFPQFMDNIQEVRVVSGNRSHWKAKGPLGSAAEWDAEMTLDEPERAIGWRSIEGNTAVKTAGRVNFSGSNGQTHVSVVLEYEAPAGPVGELVTKIFANPERQIEEDLNRFKEAVERGGDKSGFDFEPMQQSGVAPGAGVSSLDAYNASGPGMASEAGEPRATQPGETLGGSLGPKTEDDLQAIDKMNSGAQPTETDDPAVRHRTGQEFGHANKELPKI